MGFVHWQQFFKRFRVHIEQLNGIVLFSIPINIRHYNFCYIYHVRQLRLNFEASTIITIFQYPH